MSHASRENTLIHIKVHVYFVNEEKLLQERIWDPMSNWTEGALGAYKIEIAPSGQLAATSWGDGNIMLCYQSSDNTIRILNEWARERVWRVGTIITAADPDSPLCVTNFEHRGFRAARLYYKLDGFIREACWDKVQDDIRATTDYYLGGCNLPSPPNASISAIAWKSESLEMRIYIGSPNSLEETRYSGGWLHFDLSPPKGEERDGYITAVRWATGTGIVRIFYIEARGLAQVTRDNGVWNKEHIMSKTKCACSPPISQTLQPSVRRNEMSEEETSSFSRPVETSTQPYQSSENLVDTPVPVAISGVPGAPKTSDSASCMQLLRELCGCCACLCCCC